MKNDALARRGFLAKTALMTAAAAASQTALIAQKKELFKISLAEWSFNKALFAKRMSHMEFPQTAKLIYGIEAIELVNQFFMDKARDKQHLAEFKRRADDAGVKILLIMCDGEGNLGDPDPKKMTQAVQNHHKWAEAAKFFGCHSIRVNAETRGVGSFEEQQKRAAEGLTQLSQYCSTLGLNCIVENHGRLSSNGSWLAGVMKLVNLPNCGTLPDFGNFDLGDGKKYDRYKGVEEMMPYAKAVSAKSNNFDDAGNETHTDYRRMLKIVMKAGYHGHLGIEYEGSRISEIEGVWATKRLLEKIRGELPG